jgi:hypothetical protein
MGFFGKPNDPNNWVQNIFSGDPVGAFLGKTLYKAIFKDKKDTPAESRYNGIEVQKSIYGDPVPLIYGQQRLAWNLGWYANFKATPSSSSGGGKGGGGGGGAQSSFTYSASLLGFLCEGSITGIGNVWADKTITTIGALGLTLFYGTGGQTTWSYLTTNFPTQAIPYDHTAYLASGAFDLKDSPALPNLSFEINGLQQYGLNGIFDAEPSAILTDYCTDANHGCNFNALGSLTNYQNYCKAMGFFISPIETSQRPAMDFIKELLETTNSQAFESAGVLNIVPLADASVTGNGATYTPNMTPLFTFGDDDYIYEEGDDPVQVSRKAQSDMRNVVRLEYLNRANNYNTAIMEASDAQDISLNGMRVSQTKTAHMITTGVVARAVAQILLQRNLYYRCAYQFKVRVDYCLLEPMDIVALNDSGLGLVNQRVRITEVEDSEEDEITITAEELPLGPAGAPVYNFQAEQGYYANYATAPGSVQAPYIITAPALLVDPGGGYEIWIAVGGPSASSNWGGCRVLMSRDNTNYVSVGTIYSGARYGTLTASLASGSDPDSTHTLSIQLNNTAAVMSSGSTADADNMNTLIYVDGEIMSYSTATLTGAGAYNLTYLRRGKYGSISGSHSSATRFIRLDGSIFRMPFDPGMIGQTLYFKFQSFNIFGGGLESMGSLTAYSYTVTAGSSQITTANGLTLIPRGACAVIGNSIFKNASGSSAWDSDCYSLQTFSSGCAVSFSANQTNSELMIGLNSDPTTDQSYTSLDYAWYCDAAGNLSIYENGSSAATAGTYTTTTVLRIEYDGQRVMYFKDGTMQRSVLDKNKTFALDSSFYTPNGSARNVFFGPTGMVTPSPYLTRGNCVVSDASIQKIGGSGAWDSDCYSVIGYQQCHVTFKANQTNLAFMVGLNTDPLTDQSYTSLDYAWYCDSSGTLRIYEAGSEVGSALGGTYVTSTVMAITYDGSTVTYWKDGVSIRTVSISSLTLFMDSSFNGVGSGCNSLRYGPTTNLSVVDTIQLAANAATDVVFSTVSLVSQITSAVTRVALGSVTLGPYAFNTKIVVTVTATTTLPASGSTNPVSLDVAIDTSSTGTNNNDTVAYNNTSASSIYSIAREYTFSLAAGTTQTYYANAKSAATGTPVFVDIKNIVVKGEAIKA